MELVSRFHFTSDLTRCNPACDVLHLEGSDKTRGSTESHVPEDSRFLFGLYSELSKYYCLSLNNSVNGNISLSRQEYFVSKWSHVRVLSVPYLKIFGIMYQKIILPYWLIVAFLLGLSARIIMAAVHPHLRFAKIGANYLPCATLGNVKDWLQTGDFAPLTILFWVYLQTLKLNLEQQN